MGYSHDATYIKIKMPERGASGRNRVKRKIKQLFNNKYMKKLETLTPDQESRIPIVRNFWLNYILSCKNQLDKDKAKKGIEWLYKYCGKEKPVIIFMDSPFGCQVAANFFLKFFKDNKDNIWDNIWDNIGDNIRDNKMQYYPTSSYGNISDYGWVAYIDYFLQLQLIHSDREKDFNAFKDLLLSGVYDMIQLEGICIVSDMPTKIIRNSTGRLHNPNGPAIEFKDGWHQYNINGRVLPSCIWEKAAAGEITKEMFLKEQNSEIKGGIYEVLGQKKMLGLLGAIEIDTKTIAHRNGEIETVTLLKTSETFEEIDDQPFAWVKMVCPSTGTQYLQGVEPHHTDAIEAISSLSPFKAKDYSFDLRS